MRLQGKRTPITAAGQGMGIEPTPICLRPGQMLCLGSEGLGEQTQRTVAG